MYFLWIVCPGKYFLRIPVAGLFKKSMFIVNHVISHTDLSKKVGLWDLSHWSVQESMFMVNHVISHTGLSKKVYSWDLSHWSVYENKYFLGSLLLINLL